MVVKIQQMELMQEQLLTTYQNKILNLEELKKSLLQKAFNGELTQNKQAA
jgi:type I restriction enzyme S subunit